MKNIVYFFALTALILSSCDTSENVIFDKETNFKHSILSFKTTEEFNTTLAKVNAMSSTERTAWEEEQAFKSFGTICDEFYETIDPTNFKNIDELKAFVYINSDKVEFYTSSDGEVYFVSKDFNNAERYLMNSEQTYIIGSLVIENEEVK